MFYLRRDIEGGGECGAKGKDGSAGWAGCRDQELMLGQLFSG